jgi:hypothetical protein
MTVISLPAFALYQSGNLVTSKSNPDLTDVFSSFTLGNIGQCKIINNHKI